MFVCFMKYLWKKLNKFFEASQFSFENVHSDNLTNLCRLKEYRNTKVQHKNVHNLVNRSGCGFINSRFCHYEKFILVLSLLLHRQAKIACFNWFILCSSCVFDWILWSWRIDNDLNFVITKSCSGKVEQRNGSWLNDLALEFEVWLIKECFNLEEFWPCIKLRKVEA